MKFQHRVTGDVSNSSWHFDIGGIVVGIEPELLHQRLVNRLRVCGKEINESAISCVADHLLFASVRSGAGRRNAPDS